MNQPTRQQMLSAIEQKIARTSQSDEGTWHFLPVMPKDFWDYFERIDTLRYMTLPLPYINGWGKSKQPLDKQSDDCISYIYSLL